MSEYINKWIKDNTRTVSLRFNLKKLGDLELLEWLDKKENKTEYLKGLIMQDIIIEEYRIREQKGEL